MVCGEYKDEFTKKKFYSSKEAILLDSADLRKIVVSNRLKLNDTTYKYFCGYLNNVVIKPLCPIRDDKYILPKLKIFKKKNLTTFNNNNIIPIEKNQYIGILEIDIDSVLKIDKKAYPQAYLEECKYKLKKRKLVSFIDSELLMIVMKIMVMTVIMKIIFNMLFFSKCI